MNGSKGDFTTFGFADDVENIGDGSCGDIAFQVAPFNLLEKGDRTLDKGFPFQDSVQDDVGIDENFHGMAYWYFWVR